VVPLELSWDAPAECPSGEAVVREASRMVASSPGRELPLVRARGRVRRAGGELLLELRTERDGEAGVRELRARSCEAVARAAALVLAISFGVGIELEPEEEAQAPPPEAPRAPSAAATEGPGAPEPPAPTPVPPEGSRAPEPPAPSPPAPNDTPAPAERAPRFGYDVALEGGAAIRLLPSAAGFVGLGAALVGRHFRLALGGLVLPRAQGAVRGSPGVEARYVLGAARVEGCYEAGRRAVGASACVALLAGAIGGRSVGATDDGHARAPFLAGALRVGLVLAARSPLRVIPFVELLVPFDRPRFAIDGIGAVHTVDAAALLAGAALRFGRPAR
jgi:hypothetical protein